MRGRYRFVFARSGRGEQPENDARAQTLFVFDQRVPFAVHICHIGFKGLDGMGRIRHEFDRGFSASLLRGGRAVRQERSGPETVRGEKQSIDWTRRPFHVSLSSQRKHQ